MYGLSKVTKMEMKEKGWNYVGEGRHRTTYISKSGKFVFKIPISWEGMTANEEEACRYKENKCHLSDKMAKCRLIIWRQMACLMMETVRYAGTQIDLPDWAYLVDDNGSWNEGRQVGYNRRNKLVAYDYSWC